MFSKYSEVTIYTAQGVTIVVPPEQLEKDGTIRKQIVARTKELTRQNAEFLAKKNVRVFVGGAN